MTLLLALAVAVLFGAGAYLLLKRDLLRVVGGAMLISNASILFIMTTGLTRGRAPIYPLEDEKIADPLVQAMALTAIVIGFGFTALLLSLIYRFYVLHHSLDQEELAHAEQLAESELNDVREMP
jgi:multicomponent Na+:H+ antiporter subunit C